MTTQNYSQLTCAATGATPLSSLETAALIMTDTLYLSEVAAYMLATDSEHVRRYVADHCEGKPGDWLAGVVPTSWIADLLRDVPALQAPLEAFERLEALIDGLTQSHANMIATQIAMEFDWSATPERMEHQVGEWTIAIDYYPEWTRRVINGGYKARID